MTPHQFCQLHEEIENKLASGELSMDQYLTRARELRERLFPPPGAVNGYGFCPHCGARVMERGRRPFGNVTCLNGHIFPSSATKN
jgi:hypothetical protein